MCFTLTTCLIGKQRANLHWSRYLSPVNEQHVTNECTDQNSVDSFIQAIQIFSELQSTFYLVTVLSWYKVFTIFRSKFNSSHPRPFGTHPLLHHHLQPTVYISSLSTTSTTLTTRNLQLKQHRQNASNYHLHLPRLQSHHRQPSSQRSRQLALRSNYRRNHGRH